MVGAMDNRKRPSHKEAIVTLGGLKDVIETLGDLFDGEYSLGIEVESALGVAIEALEALRPRPATEPPKRSCRVILRQRFQPHRWETGGYDPDERPRWYSDDCGSLSTDDVIVWMPEPRWEA